MAERLLVFGGRNFTDREALWTRLDQLHAEVTISLLIAGCATGADRLALRWARRRGVIRRMFKARWDDLDAPGAVIRQGRYGPYNVLAGFWRNEQMLAEGRPTMALMCPGGKGTRDMRDKCYEACLHVAELYEEG